MKILNKTHKAAVIAAAFFNIEPVLIEPVFLRINFYITTLKREKCKTKKHYNSKLKLLN